MPDIGPIYIGPKYIVHPWKIMLLDWESSRWACWTSIDRDWFLRFWAFSNNSNTHAFPVFLQGQNPLLELSDCSQQAVDLLRGLWTVKFLGPVRLTERFPQVRDILQETKDINRKHLMHESEKDEQVGQDKPQSSLGFSPQHS